MPETKKAGVVAETDAPLCMKTVTAAKLLQAWHLNDQRVNDGDLLLITSKIITR
jgi:hypothetical protein